MSDQAAFPASLHAVRQVRDEVHFVFAVAAELATEYLQRIGGYPAPGESRWFGIARLNKEAIAELRGSLATTPGGDSTDTQLNGRAPGGVEDRRPGPTLPNKVAMQTNKPGFQQFCLDWNEVKGIVDPKEKTQWTKQYVRDYCGVVSMSEITPGSEAELKWNVLLGAYLAENQL